MPLEHLCIYFRNLFLKSFGDSIDSHAGDFQVPASSDWIVLCTINRSSKFIIQNLELTTTTKTILINWNKTDLGGFRLSPGGSLTLDDVSGVVYVKPLTATDSIALNYGIISIIVND
jgi:hypothetical protein